MQTSWAFRQEQGRSGQAHTVNLSATGARLILPGEHVSFRHRLTLQVGGHEVTARVVWEQPLPGGHSRVAGVRFENLTPELDSALGHVRHSG